jgi:hypothetical protein
MVSPEHIAALTEARRRMPRHIWQQLVNRLAASTSKIDSASIRQATSELLNRDAAWILSESFEKNAKASWSEIAAAMVAVDYLIGDNSSLAEMDRPRQRTLPCPTH